MRVQLAYLVVEFVLDGLWDATLGLSEGGIDCFAEIEGQYLLLGGRRSAFLDNDEVNVAGIANRGREVDVGGLEVEGLDDEYRRSDFLVDFSEIFAVAELAVVQGQDGLVANILDGVLREVVNKNSL